MKPRNLLLIVLVVLSVSIAPATAITPAVWVDGNVTRAPWKMESDTYVEVDHLRYRILPGIRVSYRYLRNETAYAEKVSDLHSIVNGQKIWVKVRNNDVEQIILF